jgi:hypothetical protein
MELVRGGGRPRRVSGIELFLDPRDGARMVRFFCYRPRSARDTRRRRPRPDPARAVGCPPMNAAPSLLSGALRRAGPQKPAEAPNSLPPHAEARSRASRASNARRGSEFAEAPERPHRLVATHVLFPGARPVVDRARGRGRLSSRIDPVTGAARQFWLPRRGPDHVARSSPAVSARAGARRLRPAPGALFFLWPGPALAWRDGTGELAHRSASAGGSLSASASARTGKPAIPPVVVPAPIERRRCSRTRCRAVDWKRGRRGASFFRAGSSSGITASSWFREEVLHCAHLRALPGRLLHTGPDRRTRGPAGRATVRPSEPSTCPPACVRRVALPADLRLAGRDRRPAGRRRAEEEQAGRGGFAVLDPSRRLGVRGGTPQGRPTAALLRLTADRPDPAEGLGTLSPERTTVSGPAAGPDRAGRRAQLWLGSPLRSRRRRTAYGSLRAAAGGSADGKSGLWLVLTARPRASPEAGPNALATDAVPSTSLVRPMLE